MNIPKKVKIGWKKYKIVDAVPEGTLVEIANHRHGEIDFDKQLIILNSESGKQNREATLVHEAIHGMCEMYNLDFDEDIVEILGNAFYSFITDNKKMFKEVTNE